MAYLTKGFEFFLSLVQCSAISRADLGPHVLVLMKCKQGWAPAMPSVALPEVSETREATVVITEFQRRCPFGSADTGVWTVHSLWCVSADRAVRSAGRCCCLTLQACPHREQLPWGLTSPRAEEEWRVGSIPTSIFCENGIRSVVSKIFLALRKYACD